jgi:ribose-phosphate pyrophosphokinase
MVFHLNLTLGLFNGNAVDNINKSALDKVVVTNTVEFTQAEKTNKIIVLSVGTLLAETIRRITNDESLSEIFAKI